MNFTFFDCVDYESHPAFKNIGRISKKNEKNLFRIVNQIDENFNNLTISSKTNTSATSTQKDIKKLVMDLKKESQNPLIEKRLNLLILNVIDDAEKELFNYLNYIDLQKKFKEKKLNSENSVYLSNLMQDGFAEIQFLEKDISLIKSMAKNLLERERERYQDCDTWRGAFSVPLYSLEGHFFNDLLKRYQILDLVSNFKQREYELYYLGLDYSHSRQTWYKGCYSDCLPDVNTTNYFHLDNDYNISKMMIYLSDVKEKNGPFNFVKGSSSIPRSQFRWNLLSGVDRIIGRSYRNKRPYYDYYRPLFKDYREDLIKLPKILQGSTHFGDDLIDLSESSEILLSNNKVFTGSVGRSIIFDGYKGIHRGSTVFEGERLALQIGFVEKDFFNKKNKLKRTLMKNKISGPIIRNIMKSVRGY